MQVFVSQKESKLAIRFNSEKPSIIKARTAIPHIKDTEYSLLSIPLYMVDKLPVILDRLQLQDNGK